MGAVCYLGDRQIAVQDAERRAPGAGEVEIEVAYTCLLYTSPSPRD